MQIYLLHLVIKLLRVVILICDDLVNDLRMLRQNVIIRYVYLVQFLLDQIVRNRLLKHPFHLGTIVIY